MKNAFVILLIAGLLFSYIYFNDAEMLSPIKIYSPQERITTAGGGINNPGNLRKGGTKFQGEIDNPNEGSGFRAFQSMDYGYRAIIVLLRTYYRQGYTTLAKMMNHYAPPSENDTALYLSFLSNNTGIDPNADMNDYLYNSDSMTALVKNISLYEQGLSFGYYPDSLNNAYNLA